MTFGTDDLHMTLIDNQPRATQNSYIFQDGCQFAIGPIRFGLHQFVGPITLSFALILVQENMSWKYLYQVR